MVFGIMNSDGFTYSEFLDRHNQTYKISILNQLYIYIY